MKFIAFDLETTGTLPGVDRIVEIGAVLFSEGRVDSIFATLVDPRMSIPEAASRVNGISNEMVQGQPTIEKLLGPLTEFCGDHILVAHNAIFDFQFLLAEIRRLECPAPRGLVLDTYPMAKKLLPGLPNYKLATLVQHLKIPTSQFHRAEEDATYCAHLFMRLVQKMSGQVAEMPPLENLIALTGKAELRFPQLVPQPKQLDLFSEF